MNVTFSIEARTDLINIGEWIARENEAQAASYVAKLRLVCDQIGERPKLYAFVAGSRTLRRRLFTPYIIFYRLRQGEVFIISVRHARRDNRRLR